MKPNQTATLIEVDPVLAAAMLKTNNNFRKLKEGKYLQLYRSFARGDYQCDGSPIRFNTRGELIDGQHRLTAIKATGITVWMWVIKGIERDHTIDTLSTPRSIKDHLINKKETNTATLASAINILIGMNDGTHGSRSGGSAAPSATEMMQFLDKNPYLRDSIKKCHKVRKVRAPEGIVAAIHYRASKQAVEAADLFVEELSTTANKGLEDPVYRLQSRLQLNFNSKAKLPILEVYALIIKAWNLWICGKSCSNLRFRSSGPGKEAYPVMILPNEAK